jgi:hypothetical protein
MTLLFPFELRIVPSQLVKRLIFLSCFVCHNSWAVQFGIVIPEKAVIYADQQMSAPVGYVSKGKKIKIGEIPRNRAQVYPTIVSGKVAYIRVLDVNTEKESADSSTLVAERFQMATQVKQKSSYSVGFFNYSTQINIAEENDQLKNKDSFNYQGISLKGGIELNPSWDLDIMLNYISGEVGVEVMRAVEFGIGGARRIIQTNRLKVKLTAQALAVPFASYALGEDFRVNGYGYTVGAGINAVYRLGKSYGMELFGGMYYTKLSGFSPPDPYKEIAPAFIGNRLGAALNYQF